MGLKAGKLDRRVLLQQRVAALHPETNEEMEAWMDVASVWAEFLPAGAIEEVRQDTRTNRQPARFRIRYRPGVTGGTMRVVFDGEPWRIEGVEEKERREELVLTCAARDGTSGP